MRTGHIETIIIAMVFGIISCCYGKSEIWTDTVIKDGDNYDYLYIHDCPPGHTLVRMTGGNVYDLFALDSSTITITGGRITDLYSKNTSTLNVAGGTIGDLMSYDLSTVNITAGEIPNGLQSEGSSVVNISGGIIGSCVYAGDSSVMNISGGRIKDYLTAYHSSTINVYGRKLKYDPNSTFPNPWGPGSWKVGKITGEWKDDTHFTINLVDNLGGTGTNNTFSHVVLHELVTIFVDARATGANNGSSWANAYKYLQDALADANSAPKPVEIRIAQGIYKPDEGNGISPGDRTATFQLINGVIIKGGYAGFGESDPNARNIRRYDSILSGDLAGNDEMVSDPYMLIYHHSRADNSYHVVTATDCDRSAILDGFTVSGGNAFGVTEVTRIGGGVYDGAPTVINCIIVNNAAYGGGGGMAFCLYCYHEQGALVKDCNITANSAGYGGGIAGCPELVNCVISDNTATEYTGGGVNFASSCDTAITDCTFKNNRAATNAGAVLLSWSGSKAVFTRCTFKSNSAGNNGGAIYVDGCTCGSESVFYQCEFISNSAGACGGAMYNYGFADAGFHNCLLAGNTADADGGAIYDGFYGSTWLVNCTVAGNSATGRGGGICYKAYTDAGRSLSHCIIWGNSAAAGLSTKDAQIHLDESLPPHVSYCWIQGSVADDQKPHIYGYPLFADPDNCDYHLKSQAGRWNPKTQTWVKDDVTSPCIDAGDPMSPIGLELFPNGGRINMGAYGGTTEASKSYFGGPVCETIMAGDINGDCKVDFQDLEIMAENWLNNQLPHSNKPPNVSIREPTAGATIGVYHQDNPIEISADANDADGRVVKVEFYVTGPAGFPAGSMRIGEDTYGFDGWQVAWIWWGDWGHYPEGSYSLTATATDDDDAQTSSPSVQINIHGPK